MGNSVHTFVERLMDNSRRDQHGVNCHMTSTLVKPTENVFAHIFFLTQTYACKLAVIICYSFNIHVYMFLWLSLRNHYYM